MKNLFALFMTLLSFGLTAQTYVMSNGGSATTCSGTFFDPGGTAFYPGANNTWTYTICNPTPAQAIYLRFTLFSLWRNQCILGASIDRVRIFNGPNTGSPVIGTYTENTSPGIVTGSSGCLTIEFRRQGGGGLCQSNPGYAGWEATIHCELPPPIDPNTCVNSYPFCSDSSYFFPNSTGTTAPTGPNYGCLGSEPNPVWYYMEIGTSGTIELDLEQTRANGDPLDVDFAMWGPFTSVAAGCTSIMSGSTPPLQCSYSTASTETIGLGLPGGTGSGASTPPAAVAGQVYIVLITNFSNNSGSISFSQTGGTGATDCSILLPCDITGLTATPSVCNTSGQYDLSGTVTFVDPPTTGTLTVTNSCGGSQVFNAPFTSPLAYNLTGLTANGANCTVTATFSDNTSCTRTVDYTAPNQVTPAFTAVAPICAGGTLVALPTTSNNGIAGTWAPALNNTATTVYTFTPTAGQCATTATMTITVNPNVIPTFTPVAPICAGGTLAALPTTSTNGINGTWAPVLDNTTTTVYTFTPTAGQCATTTTMTITVNPNVTPTFTQVAPICTGGSLSALPTTSNNGINGTWAPALNNTATTTYTFTPTAGQCANPTTMTITVNPNLAPTVNCGVSTTTSVEFDWAAVTGATGYTVSYQVNGGAVVNVGAIGNVLTYTVNGLNPADSVTITVTPTGGAGTCFIADTQTCTATNCVPPTATISYPTAPFCKSNTVAQGVTLNGTGTFNGGTYTASPAGLSINPTTGAITPSTSTVGTYTVTYTIAATPGCSPVTATTTVVVNAQPNAGTDGGVTICDSNIATINLFDLITGEEAGGVWSQNSGTGGLFNAAAGTYTPAAGATTSTFTYTLTATAPCANDTSLATITINPQPNAGVDGAVTICDSDTTTINLFDLITGEQPGGVWSQTSGTGGTFDAIAGTFTPAAGATSSTFEYSLSAVAPCVADVSMATITINAQPNAGTDGAITICNSDTTTINLFDLITGEQAGGTWTQTSGTGGTFDAVAGTFTPAAGATTSAFTYTLIGTAPCINDSSIATITINTQPNAGTDGAVTICDSDTTTINLFDLITGEEPGGVWSQISGTGGTFDAVAGTFTPASGATSSTFMYMITAVAPCVDDMSVATITINTQPNAGVDGGVTICDSDTTTINLFDLISGEQSGGVWTQTSGTGGTFDPVAGTFTPASGATSSTFEYTLAAVSPCTDDISLATITINPTTTPVTGFTYITPVCSNGTNPIPSPDAGFSTTGTFASTVGLDINPVTGEINLATSTPGTYTVTYTVAATGCATNGSSTFEITITAAPTATIDYPASPFCADATSGLVTFSGTTGGTYGSTAGLSIDATTGEIVPNTSTPGTYIVTYTVAAAGGCAELIATTEVTIESEIAIAIEEGCIAGNYTLTASSDDSNATYEWFNALNMSLGTGNTLVITAEGVYTVRATSAEGCVSEQTIDVDSFYCDIPKGVSPNNDGFNDTFNLTDLKPRSVKIYNRYGMQVFEQGSGYTNQWYGQSKNGGELPDGTYYYVVELDNQTRTGWVYLNRERK